MTIVRDAEHIDRGYDNDVTPGDIYTIYRTGGQQPLPEVGVRAVEVVAHVRQFLARDAERARPRHVAGGEHDGHGDEQHQHHRPRDREGA